MQSDDPAILAILATAPQSAAELCRRLGMSQPTLSRRLAGLAGEVVRFGPQRAARYARRRRIRQWDEFTISRVTADGQLQHWGTLHPVAPEGYVLSHVQESRAGEFHQGLPWWMQDMRPQGFLGRNLVKAVAEPLDLPRDLRMWRDDHVLLALAESSDDSVGNLLIGHYARQRWLTAAPAAPLAPADTASAYRELARRALAGEQAGSSAGGEQPKFTAWVESPEGACHVLVKFTAPEDNVVSRRWRNLMACEHLALEALRRAGLPAAQSRLIDSGVQRFLEVRRFDRIGPLGRRGLVSLLAMDAEFVGHGTEWPLLTRALLAAQRITADAHDTACRLYVFGQLIGNGDMHGGNLSFLHEGALPLSIAPAYDMLPMSLSPRASGDIPDATQLNRILVPPYPGPQIWRAMLALAQAYWRGVAESELVDQDFRAQALAMEERLEGVRVQLARMA